MNARANDLMNKVAELNAGMKSIDRQLGVVLLAPGTEPSPSERGPSLAALIADQKKAGDLPPPKVDFPTKNISDQHYLNVWLSHAHSGWQYALNAPGIKQVASLLSQKQRDDLDYVMIDVLNLPGLVSQVKNAGTALLGAGAGARMADSALAWDMKKVLSYCGQIDLGSADIVVTSALVIGALGIKDYLLASGNQRLRVNHDAMVEKIDRWRSEASQGWTQAMKGWMAWGASKFYLPEAQLSPAAQVELDHYRQHGGAVPSVSMQDIPAVRAVADSLTKKYNVPKADAFNTATKMLALEERDPNRLLSFLSLRCLPSRWAQEYGISPKTFVPGDTLMPNIGHGRFRNWRGDLGSLPPLSQRACAALDVFKSQGGARPELPLQDQRVVRKVGDMLGKAFGATAYQKFDLALDLLTHEERSPDELIRRLRAEGLPGVWREKYDLAPDGVRLDNGKGI